MPAIDALEARRVLTKAYSGRRALAFAGVTEDIPTEAQAALRQLSQERLMAYGVHHADAVELRARTASGESWQEVAADLAETCLRPPDFALSAPSVPTKLNRLYRASALLRMSQMMMLSDSDERRDIVSKASDLYLQAAQLSGDREKVSIETNGGVLAGWRFPVRGAPSIGTAVVIGGVEGWAMDFDPLGAVLASRGVDTLMLDGPGQGESRLVHKHYLTVDWERAYRGVFDFVSRRSGGLPLAFVGNSMGGAVGMHLAAHDPRIVACCNNGGPLNPGRRRGNTTFFQKMVAHCGGVDDEKALEIWQTIKPVDPSAPVRCPLLIVQGGMDALVSTEDAASVFDAAKSEDKTMVIFSDGDHCVYNHQDDKHNVIGDWICDRLRRQH